MKTVGFRGLYCLTCGYDLRASEGRCPECGREFSPAELTEIYSAAIRYFQPWRLLLAPAAGAVPLAIEFLHVPKSSLLTNWLLPAALAAAVAMGVYISLRMARASRLIEAMATEGRKRPGGLPRIVLSATAFGIAQTVFGFLLMALVSFVAAAIG